MTTWRGATRAARSRVSALPTGLRLYPVAVAVIAGLGFLLESPGPIVVAAVVTLPASLVALPAYYVVVALVALVPGASPSSSSGSGTCTASGVCHEATSAAAAPWFAVLVAVLGVLALVLAALANALVLHGGLVARRTRRRARAGRVQAL